MIKTNSKGENILNVYNSNLILQYEDCKDVSLSNIKIKDSNVIFQFLGEKGSVQELQLNNTGSGPHIKISLLQVKKSQHFPSNLTQLKITSQKSGK